MTGASSSGGLRGQQRQEIAAALAERFRRDRISIQDLAREVNRRPSTVRRLLDEAGVQAEGAACLGVDEPDVVATLAARYQAGVPIETLSRDTGIDRRVIRQLLTQSGVPLRTRQPLPPERIDWVVDQYRAGATLRALADITGCSYSTIRRTLRLAGVALRSPGGRSTQPDELA